MKKHNKYAVLGLKALQRAAAKVAEDARKNNYKIPVWRNGRIEYEIPDVHAHVEQESAVEQDECGSGEGERGVAGIGGFPGGELP
ncbi:MAG: hypothetical protein R6V20_08165 [Desulfobia sp.]